MNVLKNLLEMVDNLWSLWCILIFPLVGIVMIQYFPLLTLGLIALWINFQLMSADIVDGIANFTGNEATRKRKYNCYANAFIVLLITIGCYGWFIHYDVTHARIICNDYTDWFHGGDYLPWMLPSLLQHVVTVSCPAP